jgi:hypothetical protein
MFGGLGWPALWAACSSARGEPLRVPTRFDDAMGRTFTGEDFLSALAPVLFAVVVPLLFGSDLITDRVGARPGRLSRTVWLAWMRVRGDRSIYRVAVVCLAATMAFVGVLGISASAVARATRVRSTIKRGASVVYMLHNEPPAAVAEQVDGTVVTRVREPAVLAGAKPPVDVLGVDPATFARAAVWQGNFSHESLNALLDRLDRSDDPTAALVVGAEVPDRFIVTLEGERTPVTLSCRGWAPAASHPRSFSGPAVGRRQPFPARRRHVAGGVQLWIARGPLSSATIAELGRASACVARRSTTVSPGPCRYERDRHANARRGPLLVITITFAGTAFASRSARRSGRCSGSMGSPHEVSSP